MKKVLCYAAGLRPGFLFDLCGHEVKVLKIEQIHARPVNKGEDNQNKIRITLESIEYETELQLTVPLSYLFRVYGPKTSAKKERKR